MRSLALRTVLHERLGDDRDANPDHLGNRAPLHILCLGAHSDDIEIGAAGTLLSLLTERADSQVTWVVASSPARRAEEARASAEELLGGLAHLDIHLLDLRDGYLNSSGPDLKEDLEGVRSSLRSEPDVVFTHHRDDRHQDHRAISDLTWNLWRDHLILEYEVPKWDGDLAQPNVFVPLGADIVERKLNHLATHFASQCGKDWFDEETFRGLLRLRGVECRSPSRYAEAFHGRKLMLAS